MKNRIVGQIPSEDIVDTSTGEILAEAGKAITKDQGDRDPERSDPVRMDPD